MASGIEWNSNCRRSAHPVKGVCVMQWWGWLILVFFVVALAVGAFLAVQARRRSGGVILADPDTSAGSDNGESGGPR